KSNIGHCESAAGIAGLTKVLLQLRYRQLVPSLHSKDTNANIDFTNSPFVVQQELTEWKRPVLEEDGQVREYPLCAGVSSFGAGGANAHIIIEEYMADEHPASLPVAMPGEESVLILLSATDERQLIRVAKQFSAALDQGFWRLTDERLTDIAYTLQVGREHLEHRLALQVTSVSDLYRKLEDFIHSDGKAGFLGSGEGNYDQLAATWLGGANVDWQQLYRESGRMPHRVSLPVYPFKRDRYWIGESPGVAGVLQPDRAQWIHPLLHENISDLAAQRFRTTFSGDEVFLADHRINDQKVVSAAAFLEMIREAICRSVQFPAIKTTDICLRNISWLRPAIVQKGALKIAIELFTDHGGEVGFEIYAEDSDGEERVIFSRGSATLDPPQGALGIGLANIQDWQRQSNRFEAAKAACYDALEKAGLHYGPTHRCIDQIYIGKDKLLAKISSSLDAGKKGDYFLHPGLLDAALQATLFWNRTDLDTPLEVYLPYGIEAVECYSDLGSASWVVISNAAIAGGERSFDIDVFDDKGACQVRLKGVRFKATSSKWGEDVTGGDGETVILLPEWQAGSPGMTGQP